MNASHSLAQRPPQSLLAGIYRGEDGQPFKALARNVLKSLAWRADRTVKTVTSVDYGALDAAIAIIEHAIPAERPIEAACKDIAQTLLGLYSVPVDPTAMVEDT